jgi:hypothetical protein
LGGGGGGGGRGGGGGDDDGLHCNCNILLSLSPALLNSPVVAEKDVAMEIVSRVAAEYCNFVQVRSTRHKMRAQFVLLRDASSFAVNFLQNKASEASRVAAVLPALQVHLSRRRLLHI